MADAAAPPLPASAVTLETLEASLQHARGPVASASAPPRRAHGGGPCNECGRTGADLFRDPGDGQVYCARCWVAYYASAPDDRMRVAAA